MLIMEMINRSLRNGSKIMKNTIIRATEIITKLITKITIKLITETIIRTAITNIGKTLMITFSKAMNRIEIKATKVMAINDENT